MKDDTMIDETLIGLIGLMIGTVLGVVLQSNRSSDHYIKQKLNTIMATLAELQQAVVDLQATVDAEQEQIQQLVDGNAATVAALQAHIDELQALVDAAPTPEQLQAVVDSLKATQADVASTIPDAPPTTEPPTTQPEG